MSLTEFVCVTAEIEGQTIALGIGEVRVLIHLL